MNRFLAFAALCSLSLSACAQQSAPEAGQKITIGPKAAAEPGDEVVKLPPGQGPAGKVVVARPEALDLVKYLQGLDHTYPVLPPPPRSAAGPAAGSAS